MEWVVFTCLSVLTLPGLYQGVTAERPRMIPDRDELSIQEGEELIIKCEGDESLQFSTELMGNVSKSNFIRSSEEYDGSVYQMFVFENTTHENTGWYACADAGIQIKNDDQTIHHPSANIRWIYVYVNSPEPFTETRPVRFLSAKKNGTIVIPCRPTSQNRQVKLRVGGEYIENGPLYMPKVGFILKNINDKVDRLEHSCEDVFTNTISKTRYYTAVLPDGTIEAPMIDTMSTRNVLWGKNHTLKCHIALPENVLGLLKWSFPSSIDKARSNQKMIQGNQTMDNHQIWYSVLTIKNVQIDDSGEYTCSFIGPHVRTTKTSVYINVSDPNVTFIHVTIKNSDRTNSTLITRNETKTAVWKIDIDTNPQNFDFIWLMPDLSEIKNIDNARGKYSHTREGILHVFKISNLHLRDNGNYTLRIITSVDVSDTILQLRVRTKPYVQIPNPSLYYLPERHVIFNCSALGLPLSNITWQYLEYPDFPTKTRFENRQFTSVITKRSEHDPFDIISHANITIHMTGDLICTGCNELGCVQATEPIFVSDAGVAFDITDPGTITEGDNVTLTCSASVYNYTNNLTWTGTQYEKLAFDKTRMSVSKRKTNFTYQSILEINDINKSDSGEYVCTAVNMELRSEPSFYVLSVEDARRPMIIRGNMNNSQVIRNLTDNKGYRLKCVADGRPIPTVTWRKDNDAPFTNSERFSIGENNTVLHIRHFSIGDSGRYWCRAENRIGVAERYTDIILEGEPMQSNAIWISLICVLIVVIIIVITYMGIRVHRERVLRKQLCESGLTHFVEGAIECLNPDLPVDDQAELLPYDKKWEFPQDLLKIGKQLGSGAFGVVMKAEARGICTEGEVTTVAVKMVRSTADPSYMKALASELKIMIHLGRHLNVVNLLGACTKNILTKRELHVIVEYCRFGNLHNYLQRHRSSFIDQIDPVTQKIDLNIGLERLARSESVGSQNSFSVSSAGSNSGNEQQDYRQANELGDISMSPNGGVLSNNSVQPGWRSNYRGDYKDQNFKPICTQDLLCWAWQVSRGMEYLSSRNVLHGDLAARNILLADDNIVKICDFGLAKNMYKDNNYTKKGDGPLPIKWMAIESIRDRIYSTQSDVWSFGIVLWEFFTLAQTPYPGMEAEAQYNKLIEGYRMPKPEYATDEIYEDIIKDCWKAKPSLRPTFTNLVDKIGTLLNESVKSYYCELDTPYIEMNTAKLQDGQSDYLTMMSAPNHDYQNSSDLMSDTYPDSDYLSMSPVNKTAESEIFSPRPGLSESHFEFPPPANNAVVNSDSEECVESAPMSKVEDPYLIPVDVHRKGFDLAKQEKVQTAIDNDYCNLPNNRRPLVVENNDQSPDIMKIPHQNDEKTNLQKNCDNDLIIPIMYSVHDNYVNMPQRKTDRLKDMADSFSNPSYVIMSKLENGSQFV